MTSQRFCPWPRRAPASRCRSIWLPFVQQAKVNDTHRAAAEALVAGEKRAIWLGSLALRHPAYADIRALAAAHRRCHRRFVWSVGRRRKRRGCIPRRRGAASRSGWQSRLAKPGLNALEMVQKTLKAYVLFGGVEPWVDSVSRGCVAQHRQGRVCCGDHAVRQRPASRDRSRAVAHGHVRGDLRHLRESGRQLAEPSRRCAALRRSASGLEDPACSGDTWRTSAGSNTSPPRMFARSCASRALTVAAIGAASAGSSATAYKGSSSRDRQAAAGADVLDLSMYHIDALVRRAPSLQKTREGRTLAVTY